MALCGPALVHHHPAAERLGVAGPHIDPAGRVDLVAAEHIAVDGDVVGIHDVHSIFVTEHRIEVAVGNIVRIADPDHVPGFSDTVHPAAFAVKLHILHAVDLDHPVGRGIGEHIIPLGELDVQITADHHVVADGEICLADNAAVKISKRSRRDFTLILIQALDPVAGKIQFCRIADKSIHQTTPGLTKTQPGFRGFRFLSARERYCFL